MSGGLDNVNSGGVGRLRATIGDLDNVTVKAVILAIVGSGRASLDNVTLRAVVAFRGWVVCTMSLTPSALAPFGPGIICSVLIS